MEQLIQEFEATCAKWPVRSDRQLLDVGPTRWWIGRPLASEADHITLGQGEGFSLTVRRQDVQDIQMFDEHFAIELPEDANMIVTLRKAIKASQGGRGCHCSSQDETSATSSAAKRKTVITGADWIDMWAGGCWIKLECITIKYIRCCFIVGIDCSTPPPVWRD